MSADAGERFELHGAGVGELADAECSASSSVVVFINPTLWPLCLLLEQKRCSKTRQLISQLRTPSVDYSTHMHRIVCMLLHRPFQALTPTVDGDVLQVLAGAEASFTPGEVHRLLGRHSIAGVRLALKRLAGQGVVLSTPAGRAVMYRLNRDHVMADAIVELSRAKSRIIGRMREEIGEWELPCSYAALFGSAATDEMELGSDIDVFVVRPDTIDPDDDSWRRQVDGLSERCVEWTGNDCRVLELSEADLENRPTVLGDIVDVGVHLAGPVGFFRRLPR